MVREVCNGENEMFPYIVRKPKKMRENLPLIVFLHGAGERGNGSDSDIGKVECNGVLALAPDDVERECVMVIPQCPEDTTWCGHIETVECFIRNVIKKYGSDEKRIYLTGVSMGGFGTWYTALTYPKLFAAIAPVCGGGMPWNSYMLDMPVWAFHGSCDTAVMPSNSIDMINALTRDNRYNKEIKFNLFVGVGHNAWDYAYNEELYCWLMKQERS